MDFFTWTDIHIYIPKKIVRLKQHARNKYVFYTLTIHPGRERYHQNPKFHCIHISFDLQCNHHHTKDRRQLDDFLAS